MSNEVRADYDAATIVVYQAYSPAIAEPALAAGRFVPPFSRGRMTWIKPSFLWLMERSNWARKSGQERILAVRISREGWEEALAAAVLTSPDARVYSDRKDWEDQLARALVHVQWDPERSLRGRDLGTGSIQVGLSRHIIDRYVDAWIRELVDYTPRVHKIRDALERGDEAAARRHLPPERPYPLPEAIARRLGMLPATKRRGRDRS